MRGVQEQFAHFTEFVEGQPAADENELLKSGEVRCAIAWSMTGSPRMDRSSLCKKITSMPTYREGAFQPPAKATLSFSLFHI